MSATKREIFKVTNVICRFNSGSGGPPRTVISIAHAGRGFWEAELFTTDYVEPQADRLLTDQFPGHVNLLDKLAQTTLGSFMMASGLWTSFRTQLIRGIRPDVVHLHGVWSGFLAAFAQTARQHGIPYIVAPHGMLEPWPLTVHVRRKSMALRTYQGRILRDAAAVHATSDGEAANLRSLGLTQSPIFVVPNAVDAPPDSVHPVKAVARPADARKRLLFLSRIHPKKGLDLLLHAWAALRPTAWELAIVGHGELAYVEEVKRLASKLKVENVHFYAHVDGDAREAMFAQSSAFILPTYSENFGNVVAEAMVRGLPVITTTGTPWSVVAERKLGWYVSADLHGVKQSLVELFATDPRLLIAMGSRGREYVKANLLIEAITPRLLAMYQAVLQRQCHGA
jgi:glycosyltransferase involved in cell wall biosynthesis